MISRREFLKAQTAVIGLGNTMYASLPKNMFTEGGYKVSAHADRDYWNDWPQYVSSKVAEAASRRNNQLASIHNASDVARRQDEIRSGVWRLVGGPLEKTPLNAKAVGTVERHSYKIEKIIFESQSGVYVTANVYVPTAAKPPFCALVSPPGHYPEGKEARDYQYLFQNLARKGYVVITYDPWGQGERQQYLDPTTGRPRYQDTGMHEQAGVPLVLLGDTFALYYIWDAIRALDYLATRPEVDLERVGCVGHSGGGTATMFLCALEPRFQVAVAVEGHVRNFASWRYDPPGSVDDAEQNLVGSAAAGFDRADLLFAFAPKPLLITYTTQDVVVSPFYLAAVQEVYEEVQNAYTILNAGDKLRVFPAFLPHRFDFFNRCETYAWLNQWLARKELGVKEAPFDSLPQGALNCTPTGQVLTSIGGRSVVQVSSDRALEVIQQSPFNGAIRGDASRLRDNVRSSLHDLFGFPQTRSPLQAQVLSKGNQTDLTIEEIQFRSEHEIRVPAWFLSPRVRTGSLPVVLYVTEGEKDKAVDVPNEIETIVQRGFAVCAVDLRGSGMTRPRYPASEPFRYYDGGQHLLEDFAWAGLILRRPVLGQRVWEFFRCLDYLESRPDIDSSRIHAWGVRGGGLTALLGTALDSRPRSLFCERTLVDFRSVFGVETYNWGLEWFVSGFLRKLDLPDAVAAIAPRPFWTFNPVGPQDNVLPESDAIMRLKPAEASYSMLGVSKQFQISIEPEEKKMKVLLKWLLGSEA
jgi:cephalosporin-C deacetylase-like acetyl esterase